MLQQIRLAFQNFILLYIFQKNPTKSIVFYPNCWMQTPSLHQNREGSKTIISIWVNFNAGTGSIDANEKLHSALYSSSRARSPADILGGLVPPPRKFAAFYSEIASVLSGVPFTECSALPVVPAVPLVKVWTNRWCSYCIISEDWVEDTSV